jgi:hypothetical protein
MAPMTIGPYEVGRKLDAALAAADQREPRLVGSIRDLLRDRELLVAEVRDVEAQLADSKMKLLK